jgi:hypothetical protein
VFNIPHKSRALVRQAAFFVGSVCVLAFATPALADPAIGQFELKNLESGPGYMEFQSQNAWTFGQPRRESAVVDGETIYDDNSVVRQREALEMELGFTRYLKMRIGIEFEEERIEEPRSPDEAEAYSSLKLDEIGTELIAIFIPRDGDGFGFGTVVEFERPLEREEQMSLIMGPIFEYAAGPWLLAAIPMAVYDFGGEPEEDGTRDDKWDFAYAAQLAYEFSETWTLAIEAYGTVERLGNTGTRGEAARAFGDHDQHRIGPILYYSYDFGRSLRPDPMRNEDGEIETSELTIGVGFLAGLNDNTPDGTLKLSVEVDF